MFRFIGGVAAGLLSVGAAAFLLSVADGQVANLERLSRGSVERAILTGHGAEISRRGGVDVMLEDPRLLIRQRCRGVCDDLTPTRDFRWVRILDAKGDCVVCRRFFLSSWTADANLIGEGVRAKSKRDVR